MVFRAIAASLLLLAASATAKAQERVDLALVMAVDCSGSVDKSELRLQLDGIASALRDPEIIAAATSGPHRKIAINLMLWADPDEQKLTTGWYLIDSEQAAHEFANKASGFEVLIGGGTGLAQAISYGITLIQSSGYVATRKAVDVSGDGRESWELRQPRFVLADARALRATTDIIINGLAISNDVPDLVQYYSEEVVGGPGSFVIEAKDYESFAEAMRIKLLREILLDTAALGDGPAARPLAIAPGRL